jgi:hypothetical protein
VSSGGKAPPAADYTGAAVAQGQANLEAARLGATLNRVNQQGPGGSVTYSQDPNNPDSWSQTTTLTPEQQQLYNRQVANQQGVSQLAGSQLSRLNGTMSQPFSVNGPDRISSVGQQKYQQNINAPSVANSSVDLSNIPGLTNDFSAERQRVEDSLYGSAATRLDDQFGRQTEANRTALLNQGLREGSEGYNNAMKDLELTKQDAYGNARDRAIAAGGAEQSRLYADALKGRQQSVGEEFSTATFGNQAAQQQFQNEAARTSLYNMGQDASFGQGLQNANLGNAVRDAAMREQITERNQPLQEFLALYGDGGGGTGVTGGNVASAQTPQAAPIMDAYTNQAQDQMARWQGREASAAADNQMYAGAATSLMMLYALGAFSDRRLKTDIEHVGYLPNGLPTYQYRYNNEQTRRLGVMSDDVKEFMPDAVVVDGSGYEMVNYQMIGAEHLLEAN